MVEFIPLFSQLSIAGSLDLDERPSCTIISARWHMANSVNIRKRKEAVASWNNRSEYPGVRNMRDRELLDTLLLPYVPDHSDRTGIAKGMLEVMDKGIETTYEKLMTVEGLGAEAAEAVLSALELGRRKAVRRSRSIKTPEDVYNEIRNYADRQQEHMIVVALNGAHEVVFSEVVTIGLVNMTIVHPREVFSDAIGCRASSIVIAHNHCSGVLNPSNEDLAITKRIVNAGQILGINVLDHLIISENGYMSFKEKGLM